MSVESVRSSGQIEQPQSQEQVEQVEMKAAVLQNALRSINIHGSVRTEEASGKGSIIGLIRLLCPEASREYAAQMITRVLEKENVDSKRNPRMQDEQSSTPIAEHNK